MSEIRTSRQFIVDFIERNKEMLGGIEAVQTLDGRTIDLSNMTDEEATEAAHILMTAGNPTRLGAAAKGRR
jgi:predicted butyrate kinase (DUF1464 family)